MKRQHKDCLSEKEIRRRIKDAVDSHIYEIYGEGTPNHPLPADASANVDESEDERHPDASVHESSSLSEPSANDILPIVPNAILGSQPERCLHLDLRDWMIENRVPMLHVDKLLDILRQYHPELPCDARSLLKAPKMCGVDESVSLKHFMERSIASQARIMQAVERLEMQVESNHRDVLKIFEEKFPSTEPDSANENSANMPALPVSTEEELQELEDYISSSTSNESHLIQYLAQIGGSSRDDILRRILSKVISKSCAANFSYLGKKRKKPFHALRLNAVVHGALRHHKDHCNATDHDVQVAIANWLKFAPQRIKQAKPLQIQVQVQPRVILSDDMNKGPQSF